MPLPRKIVRIGGSRYVAIPPAWLEYHERKSGEPINELLMELNNSITLKVEKISDEKPKSSQ